MVRKELIREIRTRIQFLITVQIFFASMIYAFYKSTGGSEVLANNNTLFWGIGIAFCLINYLLIGWGDELSEGTLGWIRNSVSLSIALFILPIFLFALLVGRELPGYYQWFFLASFAGSIWMPVATFVLILGSILFLNVIWAGKLLKKFKHK
jgi:hypothetical protein